MSQLPIKPNYAQYNEDLILRAFLHDVKKGFYVDVGANHPVIDSVTKIFYDQGWSGINIEPVPKLHDLFVKQRRRDKNLNLGAGAKTGTLELREYEGMEGHSTFAAAAKAEHKSIKNLKYKDYKVAIKTLASIFKAEKVKHIHFLKIDVEGFEAEVIEGNDWQKFRPEVLCIEANHRTESWNKVLKDNDYTLAVFDGLNEYYLAKEALGRLDGFDERVAALSYDSMRYYQYQSWKEKDEHIKYRDDLIEQLQTNLTRTQQELEQAHRLSLKHRRFLGRLKVTFIGLTIDWLGYRRNLYRQKKQSKN